MENKIAPAERRRIAAQVDISPAYLWQCLTGRRDIDPVEAVRIEQATQGEISRFDLCLNRGKDIWPELWPVHAAKFVGRLNALVEAQAIANTESPATENVASHV